ncbi:MAG: cation:proton antiporter, partial [Alphaproteobacteria bacterium]
MDNLALVAVALILVAFALVSARAEKGVVTPPMVFVLFGLFANWTGLLDLDPKGTLVHLLAEIALVMVLFIDAARIDLRRLFSEHTLPLRMLGIGMPLSIALGGAAAWALFPELGLAAAALLATILTPTDAALGQATVTSPALPVRIRQALNVESGLNDGLALPLVVLFLSLASLGYAQEREMPWLLFVLLQVTLGPLVGVAVGFAGGKLMMRACDRGWISESFQGLAAIGFAVLAFAAAGLVKGNGFVAAFTAGLAFGHVARRVDRFLLEFGEAEGQLLILSVFLLFGAALVPDTLPHLDWRIVLFAVLALTAIRMFSIAVSLLGSGVHRSTLA